MGYWDNGGNTVVRQVAKMGVLDSPKVYNPFLNPDLDGLEARQPALAALSALPFLLLGAERARDYAKSHRDFAVGAAAMVLYKKGRTQAHMFVHGANIKPVDDDTINVHAEHILLARIEANRAIGEAVKVPFIVVVGDVQSDSQSGKATRTLHPCGMCRADFEHPESPVDESTVILSANPDMTAVEWYDLEALRRYHDTGDETRLGSAIFDHRLDVLAPVDIDGQHHALITDTPVSSDEQLFTSHVTLPLIAYILAGNTTEAA